MEISMKDNLSDLVSHLVPLGNVNIVKIIGTKTETSFETIAEDKTVVIQGKFHTPIQSFIGTFGMPTLNKLNVILNIPEYAEDAVISVTKQKRDEKDVVSGLHFENKTGDFCNDYRFMNEAMITEMYKNLKFNGAKWSVELVPEVASIQKFKFQIQANSDETVFVAKTVNNALNFYFGDKSSHAGEFTFQKGVTGSLTSGWKWPIQPVMSILGLTGDKEMKFSNDAGAALITVDSGIATYNYILPAQSK